LSIKNYAGKIGTFKKNGYNSLELLSASYVNVYLLPSLETDNL